MQILGRHMGKPRKTKMQHLMPDLARKAISGYIFHLRLQLLVVGWHKVAKLLKIAFVTYGR